MVNVIENVVENRNDFAQNERSLSEVMSEVLEGSEYKKMSIREISRLSLTDQRIESSG